VELRITGRHLQVADDVKDYAREKLGGLGKYDRRTRMIEVVLAVDETRKIVLEARAHVGRGAPLVVHERHRDAKGAIDLAHDALERAIRKAKERARDRQRGRESAAGEATALAAATGRAEEE
jgi:ribosomal subunit interface protein